MVKQRYWGLPWYWPKIVVFDGGFFCDMVLEEGKDYLTAGRSGRYGVLDISGCSRTQTLESAQVDRRTLDGSHCAGPGGTIMGHVYSGTTSSLTATLITRGAIRSVIRTSLRLLPNRGCK